MVHALPLAAVPVLRPVAAVAAVSVVAHLAFRLYARRALGKTGPGTALRRTLLAGLPAVAVVAVVALLLADLPALLGRAMAATVPGLDGTPAGAAVVQFATGIGAVVAVLAGYLGALPAVRELRDVDFGARRAARRLGRFLVVLLVLLVAVVQGTDALQRAALPAAGLAVLVPLLVVACLAAAPLLVRATQPTREPTPAEREHLDDLLATADLSVRAVGVLDASEQEVGRAMVRGPPGYRHLFVTDHLLAAVDDDRAATVVAVAAGQARYGYVAYRATAAVLAVGGVGVELLYGPVGGLAAAVGLPGLLGPVAVVGTVAALLYGGQRLVYRVDDYAADRVGADAVARSLEASAEEYGLRYDAGRLSSLLAMRPPVGRRVARLYERSGDRVDDPVDAD